MSYEFFIVETADHVSTVTLNRPDKLNALSHEMTREFHVVLDGIEAQFPDVRAIIITGTGRGFCSGADVVEQRASLDGGGEQPPPGRIHAPRTVSITALAPRLRSLPQATIAAVNGVAAGAGLALALACDIRVASETARFFFHIHQALTDARHRRVVHSSSVGGFRSGCRDDSHGPDVRSGLGQGEGSGQ